MGKTLKIDIFTDVVCPWCLVGSVRLDKAIATLPDDIEVIVDNHPFYLDPNTPKEGVNNEEVLRAKYGKDPREMWDRVEAEAKKDGVELDLSKQPMRYPTAKAHTLTRLAKPLGIQHELANAIAEAYFLEHRQINDDNVLADIAVEFGFDRGDAMDAINDENELAITEQMATQAAEQGITGVPFVVLGQKYALSGAQPQQVFEQAIAQTLAEMG
ncbi:DsbA family oxidoreductase [Devosia rhodophyticola]|uniref:DsbA family oxidoreductase n=1 Tax=Devosia rhodophyticola TaxID=3026423 RepID=A0ABY7YUG1_9HYPH|nr:DsbA family oxidoreductase [Devosia rhodophyticola]WDR04891.1 DsbA family oxidoreductase [Devosia rhodophyticola]